MIYGNGSWFMTFFGHVKYGHVKYGHVKYGHVKYGSFFSMGHQKPSDEVHEVDFEIELYETKLIVLILYLKN